VPATLPAGAVVTTSIPYRPMGLGWMGACRTQSDMYRSKSCHVSVVVAPAETSVENDCTRGPCTGGVPVVKGSAMGHVTDWRRCGPDLA